MHDIAGPNRDRRSEREWLRTIGHDLQRSIVADCISLSLDTVAVGHVYTNALSDGCAPEFIFMSNIRSALKKSLITEFEFRKERG